MYEVCFQCGASFHEIASHIACGQCGLSQDESEQVRLEWLKRQKALAEAAKAAPRDGLRVEDCAWVKPNPVVATHPCEPGHSSPTLSAAPIESQPPAAPAGEPPAPEPTAGEESPRRKRR